MNKIDRLKKFMEKNNLKQSEIAKATGIKPQFLSKSLQNGNIPYSLELGLLKAYGLFLDNDLKKACTIEKVVEVKVKGDIKDILQFVSNNYGYEKARIVEGVLKL